MSVNNGRRIQFEGGIAGLVELGDGVVQLAYQLHQDAEPKRASQTVELEGVPHEVLSYDSSKTAKNMVVLKLKRVEPSAAG